MSNNKKTFTFEDAENQLGSLRNNLSKLEKDIENSKISKHLTKTFSQLENVTINFQQGLDEITRKSEELKFSSKLIKDVNQIINEALMSREKLNKILEEKDKKYEKRKEITKKKEVQDYIERENSYKEFTEKILKNEAAFKELLEAPINSTIHTEAFAILEQEIKNIETQCEKAKNSDAKYTEEAKVIYSNYYDFLAFTYQDDIAKYLSAINQKSEYLKEYNKNQEEAQTKLNDLANKAKKQEMFGLNEIKTDNIKTEAITNNDKTNNREATKAALDIAQRQIEEVKNNLNNLNEKAKKTFESIQQELLKVLGDNPEALLKLKKESDEYKNLSEEQKKALEDHKTYTKLKAEYDNQYLLKAHEVSNKEAALMDTRNTVLTDKLSQALDQFKAKWDQYGAYLTNIGTELSSFYTASAGVYKAEAAEVTASIQKIDAKIAESTKKRNELNEEAKTSSGGRAVAIQEQLAREADAQQELTRIKKEEEAEKNRLTKEAEKREKRAQRLNVAMSIPTAITNVASGISKALSMGLLGIPIAALIAAQGAIQIATIKKQFDKINMEDGGLLQGKRHTQGGMRIEGTNIEVEGDEFVVNRISTRKNLGLIDYINNEKRELSPEDLGNYFKRSQHSYTPIQTKRMYEDGGQLTNLEVVNSVVTPDSDKILDAISQINFRPIVSVVDIANAQQQVTTVREIAGV